MFTFSIYITAKERKSKNKRLC